MDNINIPSPSFLRFTSYQRIHQTVMNDTKVLRKEDVMFRIKHRITRRLQTNLSNTNIQPRKKQTKKFSTQKRQILIFEALKKIPNKKYTQSGQIELVRNDDNKG